MTHAEVQKWMADYLEGDLSLDRRALFDAHLDQCESCSKDVADLQATISLLRSLPDPERPVELARGVMRRIREGEGRPRLLDAVGAFLESISSPQVLVPVSVAMLGLGIFMLGRDYQVSLRVQSMTEAPGRIAESHPVTPGIARVSPPSDLGSPIGAATALDEADRAESVETPPWTGREFSGPKGSGRLWAPAAVDEALVYSLEGLVFGSVQPLRPPLQHAEPATVPVAVPSERSYTSGIRQQRPGYDDLTLRATSGGTSAESRLLTREQWLQVIRQQPEYAADLLLGVSQTEQEIWVDRLARQAVHEGSVEDVLSALRASPSDSAHALANAFQAAALRIEASSAPATGSSR